MRVVRLAGETLALNWLRQALSEGELDAALSRFALAPSGKAPTQVVPRSPILCKCPDISEDQIVAEVRAGSDLAQLQDKLKCGTFCGGCLPDIRKLLQKESPSMAAVA